MQNSIWHRPLGRKFWIRSVAVLASGVLILWLYPSISGLVEWRLHPNVMYRGVAFPVPVGWVYDPDGSPLTVKKPTSILFSPSYLDSDVSISTLNVPEATRATYADWWSARTKKMITSTEPIELPRPSIQESAPPIRCIRVLGGITGLIDVSCISEDAVWSFMFTGRESDLRDAATIMRTFAADRSPPRWVEPKR
jgi:hypothetical protein